MYSNVMKMPSSYSALSTDEMEYDGGWLFRALSFVCKTVAKVTGCKALETIGTVCSCVDAAVTVATLVVNPGLGVALQAIGHAVGDTLISRVAGI